MSSSSLEIFKQNLLLGSLSDADLLRPAADLKPVLFPEEQQLFSYQSQHDVVYFPKNGLLSLVLASQKSLQVEMGVVGREGALNIAPVLAQRSTIGLCNVQILGSGWQMMGSALRHHFASNESFRVALLHYEHFWQELLFQNALCNRLHSLEERLCRWLLMTQDRTGTQVLELTHQSLATMLGTKRVGVTLAMGILREAGFIESGKRHIAILQRQGLQERSCECYTLLRHRFEGLYNPR